MQVAFLATLMRIANFRLLGNFRVVQVKSDAPSMYSMNSAGAQSMNALGAISRNRIHCYRGLRGVEVLMNIFMTSKDSKFPSAQRYTQQKAEGWNDQAIKMGTVTNPY